MSAAGYSDADRHQLAERGISLAEARRQLGLIRRGVRYTHLVRPCTVGDGIERIPEDEIPELLAIHAGAAKQGRFMKFVPASGAASRMFRQLLYFQRGEGRELAWTEIRRRAREGREAAAALVDFLDQVRRLPFYSELKRQLFKRGEDLDGLARVGAFQPVLDAFLGSGGMDCDALPKGLLKFHAYEQGSRTSFEEHLVEASAYCRDGGKVCRLHFTVSPEHRPGFEELLNAVAQDYGRRFDASFEVGFSVQKPLTDTLAADPSGDPLRDADGLLRLRPGGHGALIENLQDLQGDLVYVKNIDNVQPDRLKRATVQWKKLLGGYLVRLQRRALDIVNRLREAEPSPEVLGQAAAFLTQRLHFHADAGARPQSFQARRASMISRLNRPIRVCGVVPNTGEPGGGPFWVRGSDGSVSLQIVETAQIDPRDEAQQQILRASTHFNPVDLVCAVRDAAGEPFDLKRFIDEQAVIIASKSVAGREVRALERPGLWNGGMAGWHTVFVEVPIETFSPVKTVLDLLRLEHQAHLP